MINGKLVKNECLDELNKKDLSNLVVVGSFSHVEEKSLFDKYNKSGISHVLRNVLVTNGCNDFDEVGYIPITGGIEKDIRRETHFYQVYALKKTDQNL